MRATAFPNAAFNEDGEGCQPMIGGNAVISTVDQDRVSETFEPSAVVVPSN